MLPSRPARPRPVRHLLVAALAAALVPLAFVVGVAPAGAAPVPLSVSYSQGFDTLSPTGTANAWADDTTIAGWYSSRTTYAAGSGTSSTGALYSFGTGTSAERALGSIASGGTGTVLYGVRLVNDTGTTVNSLSVAYTGEQWRTGGSSTATASVAQKLDFQYQVGATALTSGAWTDVDALDFTSPVFGTTTGAALDGNSAANRVAVSGEVTGLSLAPGQEIWLRWQDVNDANNDHGLAVDDLTVTASAAAAGPKINEFSASTTGTDVEYLEVHGAPSTDYSAYTLLEIEGDAGTAVGTVDEVVAVGTTDAGGLFLANLAANALENGSITLLLVQGFTGTLGTDLDSDDDGAFDTTPWTAIADAVAVNDGGAGDVTYGVPSLGVSYDGQPFAPGGASRIPDGTDTDTAADWVRNDFDLAGIPGFTGTPVVGEALNTPGAPNQAVTGAPGLSVDDVTQNEGDSGTTTFTFTVSLSAPAPTGGVTFDIATADGTATTVDGDYAAGSLAGQTIPAGNTTYSFDVTVNGDTTPEPNETFLVSVTNVTGADEADGQGQGTIVNDDGPVVTPVHDIQGSGTAVTGPGPFTVEAIVVGDYQTQGSGQLRGFFLQEEDADADADPATSEGIFVFCSSCPIDVAVGDEVRVTGNASEFFAMSQLSATTAGSVTVLSSGNPLPTPATVDLPVPSGTDVDAYYEAREGMLVTFPDTLTVSEYFELARYGQVILTEGGRPRQFTDANAPSVAGLAAYEAELARRTVILDDTDNVQNRPITTDPDTAYYHPEPGLSTGNFFRGGDTITGLTGVLHWSFAGQNGTDAWRIRPVVPQFDYAFTPANPRPAAPVVGGSVQVASFNVLNYFLTIDTTASDEVGTCGPSLTMDCRGADSAQELERQRTKLTAALQALDAEVVGLVEMENTPGVDPAQQIVDDLNAAIGSDAYARIDTGVIGTDAIRVGLVYKPGAVTPVGDFEILDSTDDPRFDDDRNRPALAQTFEEIANGQRFTVVVNHLKSKGSPCDGDPDLGDGQGNCNVTRTQAALALADWLATDPTGSGDPDFLVIGDLNSYAEEDPIAALEAAGYVNLVASFGGPDAYSYVFDGQLGYLDHALASASLVPSVTGTTEWHVNADEVPLFDYNDDARDPGESSFEEESDALPLYEPNAYRTSDHDPVIVGVCQAPTLTVTPSTTRLWPPNHKYRDVTVTLQASSDVAAAGLTLVSVTSDEPDDGDDDGNTTNDIVIVGDTTFKLRAERSGSGDGRTYTLTYRATNGCGASVTATATVVVPLNNAG